jgi:type I restriction enzyme M protein
MSNIKLIENDLRKVANNLRTNSQLWLQQFSEPVLGLVFLKYADIKFGLADAVIQEELTKSAWPRWPRKAQKDDYISKNVIYLPAWCRYADALNQPESNNMGEIMNDIMRRIEEENPDIKGILPKTYHTLHNEVQTNNELIFSLLKAFNSEMMNNLKGDVFGNIYEYFLGEFALAEWQGWGEFFTPRSLVKLLVNILEPISGTIYDPACGSWGMFVQSFDFAKLRHNNDDIETLKSLITYGQDKNESYVKLCKLNLAIHGIQGKVSQWVSYYDNPYESKGKFDFVIANPPFNISEIDNAKLEHNDIYDYGVPSVNNANYLWIQLFLNSLNPTGRAGFVMGNNASDARNSEQTIRAKIIQDHVVDVMIAVWPNMFYNVTLPCTLWFFDKRKVWTDREDKVLFINTKDIFRQIDRAHREYTEEQIAYITYIVKLYRWETDASFTIYLQAQNTAIELEIKELITLLETTKKNTDEFKSITESLKELNDRLAINAQLQSEYETNFTNWYRDILWLCKAASTSEIESNSRSLNPWRYTWVAKDDTSDVDLKAQFESAYTEFVKLSWEASELENKIISNGQDLLTTREE